MRNNRSTDKFPRENTLSIEHAFNIEESSTQESAKSNRSVGAFPREKVRSHQQVQIMEGGLGSSNEGADDENDYGEQGRRTMKLLARELPRSVENRQVRKRPIVNYVAKEQRTDRGVQKDLGAAETEETKQPIVNASGETIDKASGKVSCYKMAQDIFNLYDFALLDDQLFLYCRREGFWKIIKESEANREIRDIIPDNMRGNVSKNSLYEIYEWLRYLSNDNKVDDNVQKRKYYINFADCAYDWKNNLVEEKRKKLLFRYALHLSWDSLRSRSYGAYAKFINDVFGDDLDTVREFRKFLGLCLSDLRNLKVCFFLYGPSNSGKTVVLNLLKSIVGEEWCSSLSFAQMSNEFAITQLLGKRLNLSGEVSGASNKRLDIFKSLTGNDMITACFKGKDHFQFRNESLLVFACNSFPAVSSLDEFDSFLSKIIIFPFLKAKPCNEWIANLEQRLLKDAHAIVADAINGLRDLEKDGYSFNESRAMKGCKQDFLSQYNSFALFADEFIIQNPDGKITSDEIRGSYYSYCQERGYMALSDNVWSQYLKQKFMCESKVFEVLKNGQKHRKRGYQGIKLIQREPPH